MNFAAALLDNSAPAEKLALFSQQGDVSYAELRQQAQRVAQALRQAGLQPGERVLLVGEASPFWVFAYLGIALAGCVSVPLPIPCDSDFCRMALARTEARFAFVQGSLLRRIGNALADCELVVDRMPKKTPADLKLLPFEQLAEAQVESCFPAADDDLAVILFTSGSTAEPRGVMLSHGNICNNTADIIAALDLTSGERIMAVLPFFYCFGTSLLHTHLKVGGSLVIDNRFLFPDKVLQRMIDTACTGFAGVPSTYQILLRQSSLKQMQFPALRKLQQAGGKLSQAFIAELEETLPTAELFVMYGQTEATARLSCIAPTERRQRPESIGRGLPQVVLRVLNDAGDSVVPGEIGEVVASGPNVALGYWRDPEASAVTFKDGWLHTGDLAMVDQEGYVTIVDRIKDFLKCGGKRVSCRAVEEQILGFDGLVEAAVIPIPDDLLGEAVCLYAVHSKGEAVREALSDYCNRELERHLVPRKIVFLEQLPKNSSGKYNKRGLREQLQKDRVC